MGGYKFESRKVYQIKAYAKINLGLDVLGKLPNGYHEVKMVMQTVGIYDVLSMERIPVKNFSMEILAAENPSTNNLSIESLSRESFSIAGDSMEPIPMEPVPMEPVPMEPVPMEKRIVITTDSGELPVDEDNLIYKAAKLLFDKYGITEGVRIHLQKNIPIAAGMAGGSTDAAATLRGISHLFHLGCSMEELMELGVKIGADVPYCVMGGTALAEGIGEKLTALPPAPECILLVAKPDINVSTKYVYEHLDVMESFEHPDIDRMVQAIEEGSLAGVVKCMGNVLESVTVPAYPIIDTIKKLMKEYGAANSMMSGSGPTVFGIFTEQEKAQKALAKIEEEQLAKQVFLTGFCPGR